MMTTQAAIVTKRRHTETRQLAAEEGIARHSRPSTTGEIRSATGWTFQMQQRGVLEEIAHADGGDEHRECTAPRAAACTPGCSIVDAENGAHDQWPVSTADDAGEGPD